MKRRGGRERAGHERWLVSYADFITLLFAFFVVLYAASKADQRKQAQAALSIDTAFRALGVFQPQKSEMATMEALRTQQQTVPVHIPPSAPPAAVPPDMGAIRHKLEGLLARQLAEHTVALRQDPDGLVISLREAGFYDSGSASPHPGAIATLNQIAYALTATPYDIRIEGHTDNVPIHTGQFNSNWELSTARATTLARLFIVTGRLAPERLSVAGYAEFHPVASNATPDGRAQNRRVDVIVLPRATMRSPVL